MTPSATMPFGERVTARTGRFLSSGKFAAFALFALFFYQGFIALMAFAPEATGVWGDFLEDFRTRCFRYDAKSGWLEMTSVWVMLSEPVALEAILVLIWWKPLQEFWRESRRGFGMTALAALVLVGVIAASLLGLGRVQAAAHAAFPATRLRTALPMPPFQLKNQDDQTVSLTTLRGRVVIVTAIYSTCTTACPMILQTIRQTLDTLTPAERAEMAVLAFSLNPDVDRRELRELISKMYGLNAQFHFVNGGAGEVNTLLDELGVVRIRDEKTGEISHTKLFMLLDRQGRIAYRLSSSSQEQSWLPAAVRTLLAEKAP